MAQTPGTPSVEQLPRRTVSLPVRVGCVSYLNTLPLIEGLEKCPELALVPAVPARLIDLLADRKVDIGLVSLVDTQRSTEPLDLIPAGMIGCDGPTLTVRLYSAVPLEQLTRVHADAESHTAVCLMRLLLARVHGVRPEIIEFNTRERVAGGAEMLEWPEAVLMIGDKVVTDSPPAVRYPHQLDLGEAWKAMTGLPFVYAVWTCREADAGSDAVRLAASLLDRQRRHNATRLGWLATNRAASRGWPADLARRYLSDMLRFDVGPEGSAYRRAIDLFLDQAHAEGFIPRRRPVRWLELGAPCPA